jgi:predicted MFS family arabinose efflux permease
MGFGAVGLFGNWLGGLWVDSKPLATTALFCIILALGMAATTALAGLGSHSVWFALALGIWGIANTALYPICQIRVMKAATGAQALAGTINVSAANGGIALGAALGGLAISSWGVHAVGYASAALALVAVVVAGVVSAAIAPTAVKLAPAAKPAR